MPNANVMRAAQSVCVCVSYVKCAATHIHTLACPTHAVATLCMQIMLVCLQINCSSIAIQLVLLIHPPSSAQEVSRKLATLGQ